MHTNSTSLVYIYLIVHHLASPQPNPHPNPQYARPSLRGIWDLDDQLPTQKNISSMILSFFLACIVQFLKSSKVVKSSMASSFCFRYHFRNHQTLAKMLVTPRLLFLQAATGSTHSSRVLTGRCLAAMLQTSSLPLFGSFFVSHHADVKIAQ